VLEFTELIDDGRAQGQSITVSTKHRGRLRNASRDAALCDIFVFSISFSFSYS